MPCRLSSLGNSPTGRASKQAGVAYVNSSAPALVPVWLVSML